MLKFDNGRINVMWRGTDMLITMPYDLLFQAHPKTPGQLLRVREVIAGVFGVDVKKLVDNHEFPDKPKGWLCWRVKNGKLPRNLHDPHEPHKYWSKKANLLEHKDNPVEPDINVGAKVVPSVKDEAAQPPPAAPQANMVAVDADLMRQLIASNAQLAASNRLLAEEVMNLRLKLKV